ncbi:hypothetical protein [Testudinibacter aquarius]|nr:hypothetical protein [Testudinibacter aquarius]
MHDVQHQTNVFIRPSLLAHAQNGKTKVLPNAWLYENVAKLVEKIKAEA